MTTNQNTRDTFAKLRELTEARDSLPIDWARFNALVGDIDGAESFETYEARFVAALIGACTEKPMTEAEAHRVGDLLGALADAQTEADCIEPDQLAALLRELTDADDAAGLWLALRLVKHDVDAYIAGLRALADDTDPSEPGDPARLKATQARVLQSAALLEQPISDALAAAFVEAVTRWHALNSETQRQRETRRAFREARRLMDTLGEEHPLAFDAVVKAIELQDPGCCDRMLAECGIRLPKPTHVNAAGEGLLSLEQVAGALGVEVDELVEHVARMEGAGLNVRQQPVGMLQ